MRRLQLGFAELEHDAQSAALRRVRQRALAEIRRRELLDGLLLLALAETEERGGDSSDYARGRPSCGLHGGGSPAGDGRALRQAGCHVVHDEG